MTTRILTCLLGASLLAMPVEATAQIDNFDMTPDATRVMSDPTYLPLQGQIYGGSAYSYATTQGRSVDTTGAVLSSFHNFSNVLTQELEYGVTDDLAVRASISYDASNVYKDHSPASGTVADVNSAGFTNPTFGATYRVFDESPLSLDILGSYTPYAVDRREPEIAQDGSITLGGQSGSVGAALGYKLHSFTVQGGFAANFYNNDHGEDLATGDLINSGPYTDYTADLMTQTRLSDRLSVNAGYVHTFSQPEWRADETAGNTFVSHPGGVNGLRLALNYHFVPNTVVGSVTYDYNSYDTGNANYPGFPAANASLRDRNENVFGVHVGYLLP